MNSLRIISVNFCESQAKKKNKQPWGFWLNLTLTGSFNGNSNLYRTLWNQFSLQKSRKLVHIPGELLVSLKELLWTQNVIQRYCQRRHDWSVSKEEDMYWNKLGNCGGYTLRVSLIRENLFSCMLMQISNFLHGKNSIWPYRLGQVDLLKFRLSLQLG